MKVYIFPEPLNSHCELQPDSMTTPILGQPDTHPVNGAECQSFDVPDTVPNKNGAWVRIGMPGRAFYYVLHGLLIFAPPAGELAIDVYAVPQGVGTRPFRLDGQFPRYLDDGTELLINGSTGFRLASRFFNGELAEADAFCQSLVAHHFNTVRVAALQDTTLYLTDPRLRYRIHPADRPDYYEVMSEFLHDYLPSWGLYPDLIAFTQTQTLMRDPQAQIVHKQKLMDAMWDVYGLFSDVNENDQHDNRVDPRVSAIGKPPGAAFLHSSGSNGAGNKVPPLPVRDYVEFHTNDLSEWQRKAKDTMDIANGFRVAGLTSELTRADSDPNPWHHEDDGKTAAAMTMGGYCHTSEGKNAEPFGPSEAIVAAHNKGLFDGGVNFRRGAYGRRKCEFLRCYSMSINGTYAWPVRA